MGIFQDFISKNQFSQIASNLQSGIQNGLSSVTSNAQKAVETFNVSGVANQVSSAAKQVTSTVGNFFSSNTRNVSAESFANIADKASDFITSGLSNLSKQSSSLSKLSQLDVSGFTSGISNAFSSASSLIRDFSTGHIGDYLGGLSNTASKVVSGSSSLVSDLNRIMSMDDGGIEAALARLRDSVPAIDPSAKLKDVKGLVSSFTGGGANASVLSGVKGFINGGTTNVKDAVGGFFNAISAGGIAGNDVTKAAGATVEHLVSYSQDLITKFTNGTIDGNQVVQGATSILGQYKNIADRYVKNAGDILHVDTSGGLNAENMTQMISTWIAGSKDSFDLSILEPNNASAVFKAAFADTHGSLNDLYTTILQTKNQLLGIDRTGQHIGDKIATFGDSVISGFDLPWYSGDNERYTFFTNAKGSGSTLLAEALGSKEFHSMQSPGSTTNDWFYMLLPDTVFDMISNNDFVANAIGLRDKATLDYNRDNTIHAISNADTVVMNVGWNDYSDPRALLTYCATMPAMMMGVYARNPDATLVLDGGYNPSKGFSVNDIVPLPFQSDVLDEAAHYGLQVCYDGLDIYKKALCLMYPGEAVFADLSEAELRKQNFHVTEAGAKSQADSYYKALQGNSTLKYASYGTSDAARQTASQVTTPMSKLTANTVDEFANLTKNILSGIASGFGQSTGLHDAVQRGQAAVGQNVSTHPELAPNNQNFDYTRGGKAD